MSNSADPTVAPWVATLPSIQNAVSSLLARSTHQHFIGYLYVRKLVGESGTQAGVKPHWPSLGAYLLVNGGPAGKPHLRPFCANKRDAHQEWLNRNLAGSFSPSSIRVSPSAPFSRAVAIDSDSNYALRDNHVTVALRSLLLGQPMNVVDLAMFLYRDRGIWSIDTPTLDDLITCFRHDFRYKIGDDDEEFNTLYYIDPAMSPDIFEPLVLLNMELDEAQRVPGSLTTLPVRQLTASDLGLDMGSLKGSHDESNSPSAATVADDLTPIPANDEIYIRVRSLIPHYGGIVFVGPSGTGKSYYARRIALALTEDDPDRYRFVQFHPSYQYEDFVEGFRPNSDGTGFTLTESPFLQLCKAAITNHRDRHVLVIDELSRGDPGRVFGEALTYLELSKRGMQFHLASGKLMHIPRNLLILATMNSLDYGADQVDAAFDRRFAKIQMHPDATILDAFLKNAGMDQSLRQRVCRFFNHVNELSVNNPYASLGHTYFLGISDIQSLQRLWDHQLEYNLSKAFPLDTDDFLHIRKRWHDVVNPSVLSSNSEDQSDNPDL